MEKKDNLKDLFKILMDLHSQYTDSKLNENIENLKYLLDYLEKKIEDIENKVKEIKNILK